MQGGGEGEKSEEEEGRLELEITRRWKIGDAIKEEGIVEIRWVGGKSKKPPLPSSFPLPSFLPSHPSSPSFICGGINKNLRAIYGGSSAGSGGSINLLRSARLARRLQNRRPSSLYEARID